MVVPGFRCAVLLGVMATGAFAQSASVIRTGSFEVGGFAGVSYGIDQTRLMGGGNVTYALTKYILPYAEYSYFPGIGRKQSGVVDGLTFTNTYSIPLSDFHGGVHIRFPIREHRLVPYGVFGMGALTHFDSTPTVKFTDVTGVHSQPLFVAGGSDFAINFGGGLRYYINQRFGVRLEAKVYKPTTGAFTNTFGKVEGGFFFQLR